jgi:carbon starvation protein CstA
MTGNACHQESDGVDRMVLPNWKNSLIELLNIAGVGPVIGVILGIKFGATFFSFSFGKRSRRCRA